MPDSTPCTECAACAHCALQPLLALPGLEPGLVSERRLQPGEPLLAQGVPTRQLHAVKLWTTSRASTTATVTWPATVC